MFQMFKFLEDVATTNQASLYTVVIISSPLLLKRYKAYVAKRWWCMSVKELTLVKVSQKWQPLFADPRYKNVLWKDNVEGVLEVFCKSLKFTMNNILFFEPFNELAFLHHHPFLPFKIFRDDTVPMPIQERLTLEPGEIPQDVQRSTALGEYLVCFVLILSVEDVKMNSSFS